MINPDDLAKELNKSRVKVLVNFSKITLTKAAALLVARLFYNPDCISTVNLSDLIKTDEVKLSDLSSVMITAAPSTLANYANKHQKLHLTESDIIDCFANDHIKAVLDNKIDQYYRPEYALSHVLLRGKVQRVYQLEFFRMADINSDQILFKKVLIPKELKVAKGNEVWHHFGVVIDIYNDKRIFEHQLGDDNFQKLLSATDLKVIDFSDKKIFRRDSTGRILREQKNLKKKKKPVSDQSISKIELPKDDTIKFIH
jgi:hypothetical protein